MMMNGEVIVLIVKWKKGAPLRLVPSLRYEIRDK